MPTMGVPIAGGPAAGELTIGVALQIPQPWAGLLQQRREEFGDPQARSIPAHVTLLPPTAVPVPAVNGIAGHLSRVAAALAPFPLRLEGTDTFRPVSPVVFVRVAEGGHACDAAQQAVRAGPLRRELTFPFHPHVTVAHHLDDAALDRAMTGLAGFEASFVIDSFMMYEHGTDGVWRPRERFDFGRSGG
jgi:2'-5' RNA ligase